MFNAICFKSNMTPLAHQTVCWWSSFGPRDFHSCLQHCSQHKFDNTSFFTGAQDHGLVRRGASAAGLQRNASEMPAGPSHSNTDDSEPGAILSLESIAWRCRNDLAWLG